MFRLPWSDCEVSELIGVALGSVVRTGNKVVFTAGDLRRWEMEAGDVNFSGGLAMIEDICGDLEDLVGSPILMAEEITEEKFDDEYGYTKWTFYKFATRKGYVTLRWRGGSMNDEYGEAVCFNGFDVDDGIKSSQAAQRRLLREMLGE